MVDITRYLSQTWRCFFGDAGCDRQSSGARSHLAGAGATGESCVSKEWRKGRLNGDLTVIQWDLMVISWWFNGIWWDLLGSQWMEYSDWMGNSDFMGLNHIFYGIFGWFHEIQWWFSGGNECASDSMVFFWGIVWWFNAISWFFRWCTLRYCNRTWQWEIPWWMGISIGISSTFW